MSRVINRPSYNSPLPTSDTCEVFDASSFRYEGVYALGGGGLDGSLIFCRQPRPKIKIFFLIIIILISLIKPTQ